MKIVFVFRHNGYFRYFSRVIGLLCQFGYEVIVLSIQQFKAQDIERPIKLFKEQVPDCEFQYFMPQRGLRWRLISHIRQILNYAFYFRSNHPSPLSVKRWEPFLLSPIRIGIRNPTFRKILISNKFQTFLKKIERLSPPEKRAIDWLKENSPDVVVASPGVFASTLDLELIKAARSSKIPTIVALASWDNLTTKGTFHVYPDHLFVWNQPLLKEAVEIHDVKKEKVVITGAPSFDVWFEMSPELDVDTFCRQVGLDPEQPYIVYLSSSKPIAGDESHFVRKFAGAVWENEQTRNFSIVVRPHPTNAEIWNGFAMDNVIIWPKGGDLPDTPESLQSYYDTLYHSMAVVGVNTSAFLEAAVVDKPCLTIMNDYYRHSQSGLGHFQHLLNGNFIEIANTYAQAAEKLANIHLGMDEKAGKRKVFVKEFIRPRGLDLSASKRMADVIESIVKKKQLIQ